MQKAANRVFYIYQFLLFSCVFSSFKLYSETFADLYKPLDLEYLYRLVDSHPGMKEELDSMFRVKSVHNLKEGSAKKVMSYCLFWKPPYLSNTAVKVNQKTIYQKGKTGKHSFYAKYVHPLLIQLRTIKQRYPGWVTRIYLAHDLEFLLPKFTELDAEVFVMASNSIAASPGAMWRFLVFDDPAVAVAYCRDADFEEKRLDGDFSHTNRIIQWALSPETKGFFRIGDPRSMAAYKMRYNPIMAGCFGAKKVDWIHMEKAMKGFILHRKLFIDERRHPQDVPLPEHPYGFGNEFPNYGFDERFLKHVLYFAATERDQLTFIFTDSHKMLKKRIPQQSEIYLDLKHANFKSFG